MSASTVIRSVLVFLVVWTSALASHAEGLQAPAFATGELGSLVCKTSNVKSFPSGTTVFGVDVTNGGELACEPMVFRCEWKDGKGKPVVVEVARAPLPRVSRLGRPVPARGKETYVLQIATGEPKQLRVSVVEALFSDARRAERPPVRVGRIEHGRAELHDAHVSSSTIELANELPHVVDVVLRARCTAPKDATVLFTATIGVMGAGKIDLLAMPLALEWNEPSQYYPGAEIAALELVDWSARVGSTREAARALLEPAYTRWVRHTSDTPAIEARYRAQRESVYDEAPSSASGGLTVSSSGRIAAKPSTTVGNALVNGQFDDLFAWMRRPSFEELLAKHELELVAPGLVALHGPGFGRLTGGTGDLRPFVIGREGSRAPVANAPTVRISAEGRIVAYGTLWDPDATRVESRTIGGGWVVAVERNAQETNVTQYVHQLVGDTVVPVSRRNVARDALGKVLIDESCRLEDVVIGGKDERAAGVPPSGPDADALRAHWGRLHRYGASTVELDARFTVATPGTDFVWHGQRKLEGRVELGGFRGFLRGGRCWERSTVKLDGKLAPSTAASLKDAFIDRFVLWAGRDPAGLEAFDEQFRGARITRDPARELYRVDSGPIEAVLVDGGRIASLRFRAGYERKYAWRETPVGLVATRVQTGEEVLEASWSEVAKGRWLPTEFEFRKVFGPDWGPETIRLTSVQVR